MGAQPPTHRGGYLDVVGQAGVALEPASACRGVPASVYVDNRSAFVDAWFLRAFAKRGIRMVHSTPEKSARITPLPRAKHSQPRIHSNDNNANTAMSAIDNNAKASLSDHLQDRLVARLRRP